MTGNRHPEPGSYRKSRFAGNSIRSGQKGKKSRNDPAPKA
jgi:hypothetical protein